MTTNLDWQTESVSAEDRQMVGAAVLRTAIALEKLATSNEFVVPAEGSVARVRQRSELDRRTTEGNTHVDHAHSMVASSCLAAADHMRAFVISVRSGRTTVSTWTLARGAIEALGRADYLLQADDAARLLARYVAMARAELRFAHLGDFSTRSGEALDISQYLADLDGLPIELGIDKVKAPSITTMASDLLEAAAPGSGGRSRYSQLSGAAHGQTPALGMFRITDNGRLILPRQLVLEASHMQIGCALEVGDRVVKQFTQSGATRERWIAARRRILEAVGILPESRGKGKTFAFSARSSPGPGSQSRSPRPAPCEPRRASARMWIPSVQRWSGGSARTARRCGNGRDQDCVRTGVDDLSRIYRPSEMLWCGWAWMKPASSWLTV